MSIPQRLSRFCSAVLICAPIFAQSTTRVSVATDGTLGNQTSTYPSISADGRYVAFWSNATNLVPGDTNGSSDVFVRDRLLSTTERVSVATSGSQGNFDSYGPFISADGRFVAFTSEARNLVHRDDTNGVADVYVRDRHNGITERVSVDSSEGQSNGDSYVSGISADGRYVTFGSYATNLVPGDTNGSSDVFVRDRKHGTTERVSVATDGTEGNAGGYSPSISADGRFVAFESRSTDLVSGVTSGILEIFVRDRWNSTTDCVSLSSAGVQSDSDCTGCSISADGRFVAFDSGASNLVPGDTNATVDCFVRDRLYGTTQRVSVSTAGAQGNSYSGGSLISADGRFAIFASSASDLVPGDTNGYGDVFVRDLLNATTERVNLSTSGVEANGDCYFASVSRDGRYVAYESMATNLAPGEVGPWGDVLVTDRVSGETFTSLCDPGVGGVIECPCSNAPSGLGRGCDNSAHTGGASLSASGAAYLSMDSLVFTTSGEVPTATSIVLQGTGSQSAGIVFGQGVRCVVGSLHPLYTKSAPGGSITAPDFGAGDSTVSARSAASGDVIRVGERRWYFVYYRDPIVFGGCSPTSKFNATQSGSVDWSL